MKTWKFKNGSTVTPVETKGGKVRGMNEPKDIHIDEWDSVSDITDCPDCEGEGLPERTDTDEGWTKCGNCKGWMPPVEFGP